ncbi:TP0733 family outer membrane beta-barrel protein [Gracilinema caldarium]|uniref:Outer membrane protein beta-barrel domain-containing protein n=1 Tax=Gracilinema caldarium (strain ATCC 51460 / DSM 7334 / H1) TaxID=744872 RepID=F8EZ47_GRAC1|nr:hypothetical protein [Gracilinema caldarium]AEJ19278.1 hypothetical protein Spica_1132 [Gracilinema caldarium DSM 7334]
MSIRSRLLTLTALCLIGACIGFPGILVAQESPHSDNEQGPESNEDSSELPITTDWSKIKIETYSKGDQTFVIALGILQPLFYYNSDGFHETNVALGGTGYLNYNYFLNSHFSIGGELGGSFSATVGENMLYLVPFGVRFGYQFVYNRFEFPLAITIGAANQGYLNKGYFGFMLKPSAAVYWRFNPDWSFGLNMDWWWLPQWFSDPSHTMYGNFLGITIGARYHF